MIYKNTSKTLNILHKNCIDSIFENVRDPILKTIQIWQTSLFTGNKRLNVAQFFLNHIAKEDAIKKRKQILTSLEPRKKMIILKNQSFHKIIDVSSVQYHLNKSMLTLLISASFQHHLTHLTFSHLCIKRTSNYRPISILPNT